MQIHPRLLPSQRIIKAVDSHTMGEPTRVIYDSFPELPGETMMEKKAFLTAHYDDLRSALMLEPRGHRDMFGALLTKPVHREADFGVIFMDTGGYLNMCGHGSMGAATVIVETGLKEATEPYTEVVLDTPSGLIRARVHVENGRAREVSILNVPSFLYREGLQITLPPWGEIKFDISFGGSFFALVDADRLGLTLDLEHIATIETLGMAILAEINRTIPVRHPTLDIHSVDLVEFYAGTSAKGATMKNCVVFGDGQIDRSPCGTGTSAKLAALCAKGAWKLGEPFYYESITGTVFRAVAVQETEIPGFRAIVPEITGSAYLTGISQWILDEDDPQVNGFLLKSHKP
ncbi:MAG: proline racemase family protein [Aristaeellaceae bacterium]